MADDGVIGIAIDDDMMYVVSEGNRGKNSSKMRR